MNIHIALAGNPNCGKTTLFNRLTGLRQTTGNWPGVTVEKKVGVVGWGPHRITIVDLPGIYSLSPYSLEEVVTRNYILEDQPDLLVNIVDATNLERNLFLTLQLQKLGRPMLIALNMMDEVAAGGDRLDAAKLAGRLDLPVVPISARRGDGLNELLGKILDLAGADAGWPADHHHILSEQPFGADDAGCQSQACRGCAGNRHCQAPAWFKSAGTASCAGAAGEHDHRQEQPASLAALPANYQPEDDQEIQRLYRLAADISSQVLVHGQPAGDATRSERIDRLLTHRWLAFPIFLLIMFGVFQVTFHERIGGQLTAWIDALFGQIISPGLAGLLAAVQAPAWLRALLVDGIVAGVGGVLSFLPQIVLLFLFLSILEDTGYMARAAFIVDRVFQIFGLSGRSFIPMLMGFGCTVPAVMAARSLENERDRRLTIMITPFMSCGARMPIYAFLASLFFAAHKGLVIFSMYLLGIAVAILSALLLSRTALRGQESSFIIELPPYRLPDPKSLGLHLWDKVRDFLARAGTVILGMSIVIWFLQNFSLTMQMTADSGQSILGRLGSWLVPLLQPLGFASWQAGVALLTGLVAKEAVVAALNVLTTPDQLATLFTPLSAYAFMTFTLLYTPCIAALSAISRELDNWRWTMLTVAYQLGVAWLGAALVYQGGRLLGWG